MAVEMTNNFEGFAGGVQALLEQAVAAAADEMELSIHIRMNQAHTGRVYHGLAAAAAGESPTSRHDEGLEATYEKSIDGAHAEVGSNDMVAVYQELGTRHMPAHPVMLPATDDAVAVAQAVLDAGGAA